MRKIIRIAIIAVAAAALLLACEDKAPVEPDTKTDVVATPTEPPPPAPPSAEQLEAAFAKEAKEAITADNADTIAAELEEEIDGDTE